MYIYSPRPSTLAYCRRAAQLPFSPNLIDSSIKGCQENGVDRHRRRRWTAT